MISRLTALVPTFNEEENLRDCLESLRWADEIFIVDSFSGDGTLDIGREFSARIVQHAYANSAAQKNWAIPQAIHPWVLLVDADERVTPELRDEIRRILEEGPRHDGYWIRRANHFLGRRMKHCGWETDKVIRLFRRDVARYQEREVHAEIDLPGPLPVLRNKLLHYSFRSFSQYWRKMQTYSDWGASQLHREGRRAGWAAIALRPVIRFLKMYLLRLGFLDGVHGLVLCMLSAFTVYLKYAKLWELGRQDPAAFRS
jgi:glycosyltransferase involved in cell wall biosynthesis